MSNIVWISALVLIMIAVMWLLWSNTQTQKTLPPSGVSKKDKITISYVKEALVSLNVLKVSISEHYQTVGAIPSSFDELGIKESDFITNKYIDRLTMSDDGTVTMSLSRLIGEQRYIKLRPTKRIASFYLEWDCRSNLKQVILDETRGCTPDI